MVFVVTPWLAGSAFIISRLDGTAPGRFDYLAVLHLAGAVALMTIGMILSKTNCLPSAAHYLEDPRCSNALCGLFSWLPMGAICPTLLTGSAQDVAFTFADVFGAITLSVPLVEEPLSVIACYAAYASIACARILHLSSSDVGNCISLTPFQCRLIAVLVATVLFCQMRIRYLIMTWTQLTADRLEECTGTESEAESQKMEKSQQSQLVYAQDYRVHGNAAEIERNVWRRRQLYKAELTGRLLWAIHLHRQMLLSSDVLANILAFLYEGVRPVTNYVGLLSQDGRSMVSSTQHTIASSGVFSSLSSLSSVAVLRKALSAQLWVAFGRPPSKEVAAEAEQAASGDCNVFVQFAKSFFAQLGLGRLFLSQPVPE